MSDYDVITKMLDEASIYWRKMKPHDLPDVARVVEGIQVEVDKVNVIGYRDFLTEFYFDDSGNLLKMGIWEF